MHGYDSAVRSRYDYYYSISSPSLSQATNYYETQASLFGEPVQPLLPAPIQKSPSPQRISTPLTPFSNPHLSSSSSTLAVGPHTNFATTDRHPSLIENFDNHLYESIRRNILDKQNNNQVVTNDLQKHQIWTQQPNSSSSTASPPHDENFNGCVRKRASTAFDNYRIVNDDDDDDDGGYLSENKFRTVSALGDMRKFHQISTDTTTSDTDNNNNNCKTRQPQNFLQKRNKSKSAIALNTTSASTTSSKLNHTVSHVSITRGKAKPIRGGTAKKNAPKAPPFTLVKSKSDLMSLKSYPEAFTIVTSPRRSPSASICESKRRRMKTGQGLDDEDDSVMDLEWVTPPAAKLYEAAQISEKIESIEEQPPYITNEFGQQVAIPTTPIVTDKVIIGSSHRVPPTTTHHSHKRLAFAIINDYKNRRTRLMQHRRNSEDDLFMSGRFSPYTRYCLQRELSAPALNRIESFESDDAGEFYYVLDDEETEESGRKTSIGFVHKKSRLSSSMSNLTKKRPQSELQKTGPRFMSTPNFVQINKRAVIQSQPMEKINPRLILHRSLKGVLKVFNNTNIQKRTFSLDNMDIFLPNGQVDPNFLMPMPINNEEKRSEKLSKQQEKLKKKRAIEIRKRKLSPIAGTPNKESKTKVSSPKTPRRLRNTPIARLQEKLKKDKFGRLITEKKPPLPDFKKKSPGKKKKGDLKFDDDDRDLNAHEDDERDLRAINFMQQLQAKNVLGRTLKARIEAKKPPPLTKQPSKQSIESIFQDKEKPAPLKKKSSYTSLKSLSSSIRTIGSIRTNKSNKSNEDDEEAEAGDEITKLKNVREVKKDTKSKIKGSMKILSLGRATSASSQKSQKDSAPPPSRTASKTSILSHTSSSKAPLDPAAGAAHDTPSRKSEILRAPSASSVMSMTTAAITSNPLNTTLTITNQLATQGAEILEKKEKAGGTSMGNVDEITPAPVPTPTPVPSHPDADRQSVASQKTISSQKTGSKPGSRKTSAKVGGKDSAKSRGSFLGAIVHAHHAVRKLRRKSTDSIKSEKSDAPQLTMGQGLGADNKDSSAPIAGKILEHSQRSLEKVQKTVDKATHEIHQTINEKLSDLKTLEKQLSKSNLLEHDANNNDVEKKSTKGISRHSTKLDMSEQKTQSTPKNTGTTATTDKRNLLKQSTMMDEKDRISVNAISVAPDDDGRDTNAGGLRHQDSDDSNQMESSTSSSMNEMGRKRKLCWGLSSCCDRTRSESAQMIAGKSMTVPQTKCGKFKSCLCLPFEKMCKPFKRRKMADGKSMEKESMSWWERVCCCSGCCKRCTKKGREREKMKKKKMMKETMAQKEKPPSCWSRMNCFKSCKSCCSPISACLCSKCCRKSQMTDSMESTEPRPNESPSTCTRIFCFCCLCCRKSPTPSESEKRISMTSQQSQQSQQAMKGNFCSRFCTTLFCCCCKKKAKQDSRRTSMLSKKQSLAPTIPPPEEQKPKLDSVLVEHASLMKGAIPVLPMCLAYFCLICNIIIPGSGTILSGFFCLCIGIPRFSQHDGARGRIGSFIINWIVGVSQAFTIIFCLVGWGWSIWWGTIMIHLSKRNRKIKKAERLRAEDEERQAQLAAAEGNKAGMPKPGLTRGKSRDVERGIN